MQSQGKHAETFALKVQKFSYNFIRIQFQKYLLWEHYEEQAWKLCCFMLFRLMVNGQ